MPRPRSKPITPLLRTKNRIRGSAFKYSTLNDIRSTAPSDILFPIAQWSSGWLSALGIVAAIKPTSKLALNSTPFLEPVEIDAEFTWLRARFEKGRKTLERHVKRQMDLEEAILLNNAEDAVELCRNASTDLGASMHWEATTIGVLQFYLGLEAQKKYVAQLRKQGASRMLQFFSFWWSVRAEENTTTHHFISEVLSMLRKWDVGPTDQCQVLYYLLNIVPKDGDEDTIVALASSSAVIDAYEIIITLCQAAIAEDRQICVYLRPLIEFLSEIVTDPRLNRISFGLGNEKRIDSIAGIPFGYRSFEYSINRPEFPQQPPVTPQEFFSWCRSNKENAKPGPNLFSQLQSAIGNIGLISEKHAEMLEVLNKVGLLLGTTPLGRTISAIGSLNSTNTDPNSAFHRTVHFVNSNDAFLEAFSFLPSATARLLADRVAETIDCLALDEAIQILDRNGGADFEVAAMSVEQTKLFRLQRAGFDGDQQAILDAAERLRLCANRRESVYAIVSSMMNSGRVQNAVEFSADLLSKDASYIFWLPADEILKAVYCESENLLPHLIDTPIILDVYERYLDKSISSFTAYAAEDFVIENSVDTPTQLLGTSSEVQAEKLVYFLYRVCEPQRLRFFSAFESERDLEAERIDICLILAQIDAAESDKYEAEARSIVTGRLVKEALKQLQASKISIDEPSLRSWAHRNLREEFLRYQEFYKKGLVPIGASYRQSLLDALESGSMPVDLFDVPQNEAISLFRDMVTRYVQQCAFDSEHGLDCYLSLRIRHGTTSGILRSAAERESVVTRKSKESGEYLENQHWSGALAGSVSAFEWSDIEAKLLDFSSNVDALIAKLITEYIQIRRPEKPLGLFEITLSPVQIYSVVVDVDETTSFDEFVDRSAELFWLSVQLNLVKVREYIDHEFRSEFARLFDELEKDLRARIELRQLADAVLRAKNETEQSIDQLRDWFELPAATSSLAFRIEELVAVSVETLQRFHPEFTPDVTVEEHNLPPFQGSLNLFSDIFFVIFENIYKHCGESSPSVRVSCELADKELRITTTNSLSDEIDIQTTHDVVLASKNKIHSDEFIGVVRREGGTGLPKLANLLGVRSRKGHLDFNVDVEEMTFRLTFGIEARTIQVGEEFVGEIAATG